MVRKVKEITNHKRILVFAVVVEVIKTLGVLQINPVLVHIHQRSDVQFALTGNLRLFVLFFGIKLYLPDRGKRLAALLLGLAVVELTSGRYGFVGNFSQWESFLFFNWLAFNVVVFLYVWVESVLYFVLRPSWNFLAYLRPLAAYLYIELNYLAILLIWPVFPLYLWVQLVYKPLSDLFTTLSADYLWQQFPVFSYFFYHLPNRFVLLHWPYFSIYSQLGKSSVPMQALILVSISHQGCNICPLLGVFFVKLYKLIIFLGTPCFDFPFLSIRIFMLYL